VNAYASQAEEATAQLHEAASEVREVDRHEAQALVNSLPQSTSPGAGIDAASKALEVSFSPEQRAFDRHAALANIDYASSEAEVTDAEVLSRTLGNLLGKVVKMCRQEKSLKEIVEAKSNEPFTHPLVAAQVPVPVPVDETLKVLRLRKQHLEQRVKECEHAEKRQQQVADAKKQVESRIESAARLQKERAESVTSQLKIFSKLDAAITDLESGVEPIFKDELEAYATAVSSDNGKKETDVEHGIWMQWRSSLAEAFPPIHKYLKLRHAQLLAASTLRRGLKQLRFRSGAWGHEELRADKAPHLQHELTDSSEAPLGVHCPDYDQRLQELSDAISQITSLGTDATTEESTMNPPLVVVA
jgi:hypothetical protein